ncbi:helix-turn-helix transcriptional regulator [Candidatus Pacearchaeota archaeon]|nr:helix-turn-helix transcriptional regulator [Candidatus Pacearchaeota archaeon]
MDSSTAIRLWMLKNGYRVSDIARALNIHHSALSHWLNGDFKSRRIKEFFIGKGCPKTHLRTR